MPRARKQTPCLHCDINKAIDDAIAAHQLDAAADGTQRWVLHALAAVVSDRLREVHLAHRLIATADFLGQTMAYVEAEAQEELAPPEEGEHVH